MRLGGDLMADVCGITEFGDADNSRLVVHKYEVGVNLREREAMIFTPRSAVLSRGSVTALLASNRVPDEPLGETMPN